MKYWFYIIGIIGIIVGVGYCSNLFTKRMVENRIDAELDKIYKDDIELGKRMKEYSKTTCDWNIPFVMKDRAFKTNESIYAIYLFGKEKYLIE